LRKEVDRILSNEQGSKAKRLKEAAEAAIGSFCRSIKERFFKVLENAEQGDPDYPGVCDCLLNCYGSLKYWSTRDKAAIKKSKKKRNPSKRAKEMVDECVELDNGLTTVTLGEKFKDCLGKFLELFDKQGVGEDLQKIHALIERGYQVSFGERGTD